jgi:hypothetical protein
MHKWKMPGTEKC